MRCLRRGRRAGAPSSSPVAPPLPLPLLLLLLASSSRPAAAFTWSNFEPKESEPVSEETGEPELTQSEMIIEPTPSPTPEFMDEQTMLGSGSGSGSDSEAGMGTDSWPTESPSANGEATGDAADAIAQSEAWLGNDEEEGTHSPEMAHTKVPGPWEPTDPPSEDTGTGGMMQSEFQTDEEPGEGGFRCPRPEVVGCTAVDPENHADECQDLGEPCADSEVVIDGSGEHCCLDRCGRRYCTAKQSTGAGEDFLVERSEEGEELRYVCPPASLVGCTAVDQAEGSYEHECAEADVGEACVGAAAEGEARFADGERCCIDACERRYCTAKGFWGTVTEAPASTPTEGPSERPTRGPTPGPSEPPTAAPTIDPTDLSDVVANRPDVEPPPLMSFPDNLVEGPSLAEHNLGDGEWSTAEAWALTNHATTTTGKAATVQVLLDASLILWDVVDDARHGSCTVVGDTSIEYRPDPGHSGFDECGYRACRGGGGGGGGADDCVRATLSLTIAKQAEEAEVVADVRPGDETTELGQNQWEEELEVTLVDPLTLLTDEVWEEVDGSISAIAEGKLLEEREEEEEETAADPDVLLVVDPFVFLDEEASRDFEDFASSCAEGESLLTIELQTDLHGEDVTWELRRKNEEDSTETLESRGPYARHSFDQRDVCVPNPGIYLFDIYDAWGDGLCNVNGNSGCGHYKIRLDGRELVRVDHYAEGNSHVINAGYDPAPHLTRRHQDYLVAHNRRRKAWHEAYGVSYAPLRWSPALAEASRRWAERLLDDCDSDGIEHEPGVREGENLAKNRGPVEEDGRGWGRLYPAENITRRWVEREIGWDYPDNAHLTQALWRASKYLGCGEAEKEYNDGMCRVQVCRYAKAGNCEMGAYNATEGVNWLIPMLKDNSPCEPSCPPEGCF